MVLLEAMAAGLPVITTANCGGADIVTEGKDGFLIKVGDTNSLVDRILWFKNNPDEASTMSAEAVKKALNYTWAKYEEGIRSCVTEILRDK